MASILIFCLLALLGCNKTNEKANTTVFTGNAMTIDYKIIIGVHLSQDQKKQLSSLIHAAFNEVDAVYNKWNPDSELSRLNRLPAKIKSPISADLENFLRFTDEIVKMTDGRFDPSIEPLQQLWKRHLSHGIVPTDDEIQDLVPAIGWKNVHFGDGIFWKDHEKTSLDLGGIAKGYCIDVLVERINSAGFSDVYVEWGGEIKTSGRHPDKRPWTIFISRLEDADPKNAIAVISLEEQAIATSGDYLQFWTVNGVQYFHIIDPYTLYPRIATDSSIASASVMASSCALADGLATAAMMFDTVEEAQVWAANIQNQLPQTHFWLFSREKAK